eukprot:GHVT01101625.1.p1 GENE.GHVT01101625.1~~GHVT01101625.1.p1  ORF type:complete len:525 (+),score=38.45 GHVT01101625.1:1045-2619(+)
MSSRDGSPYPSVTPVWRPSLFGFYETPSSLLCCPTSTSSIQSFPSHSHCTSTQGEEDATLNEQLRATKVREAASRKITVVSRNAFFSVRVPAKAMHNSRTSTLSSSQPPTLQQPPEVSRSCNLSVSPCAVLDAIASPSSCCLDMEPGCTTPPSMNNSAWWFPPHCTVSSPHVSSSPTSATPLPPSAVATPARPEDSSCMYRKRAIGWFQPGSSDSSFAHELPECEAAEDAGEAVASSTWNILNIWAVTRKALTLTSASTHHCKAKCTSIQSQCNCASWSFSFPTLCVALPTLSTFSSLQFSPWLPFSRLSPSSSSPAPHSCSSVTGNSDHSCCDHYRRMSCNGCDVVCGGDPCASRCICMGGMAHSCSASSTDGASSSLVGLFRRMRHQGALEVLVGIIRSYVAPRTFAFEFIGTFVLVMLLCALAPPKVPPLSSFNLPLVMGGAFAVLFYAFASVSGKLQHRPKRNIHGFEFLVAHYFDTCCSDIISCGDWRGSNHGRCFFFNGRDYKLTALLVALIHARVCQ